MSKRLETPYGAAVQHDNGILEFIFEGALTDVELMKENNEFVEKHFGMNEDTLLLVDMKKVTKTTKEVRSVSNDNETSSAALALLVGGGLSRIVGNLFHSTSQNILPKFSRIVKKPLNGFWNIKSNRLAQVSAPIAIGVEVSDTLRTLSFLLFFLASRQIYHPFCYLF